MKRVFQHNRVRYHGGRPPPNVSAPWLTNGSDAGLLTEETKGVGPPLALPYRYRSLLVPLDGTPFGEHALPTALGIARRAGANVRLVHVHSSLESAFDPGRLYHDTGVNAWLRQQQQKYLDDLMLRLAKVTSVPLIPVLLQGREIAPSLHEASAGTDLVVMATHGRGPLGRLWHGSIADTLMRQITAPLLLVRGHDAPADLTGDPVVRHILIPLDGSERAEQVLGPAIALGTARGAEHTLLRVLPTEVDYSIGYPAPTSPPTADSRQEETWTYLRRVVNRLGGPARRVRSRVVLTEESPARAILRYARDHDADLIALATRGQGGLTRLFGGSVAEQVVRGTSTGVLVVRTAE